jgi:hypothetical protein
VAKGISAAERFDPADLDSADPIHLWEDIGKLESIESRELRAEERADRRARRGRQSQNAVR